jgi:hypothetical protein
LHERHDASDFETKTRDKIGDKIDPKIGEKIAEPAKV